jgi:hypothetical protein
MPITDSTYVQFQEPKGFTKRYAEKSIIVYYTFENLSSNRIIASPQHPLQQEAGAGSMNQLFGKLDT